MLGEPFLRGDLLGRVVEIDPAYGSCMACTFSLVSRDGSLVALRSSRVVDELQVCDLLLQLSDALTHPLSSCAELLGFCRVGLGFGASGPDGDVLACGAQLRCGGFELVADVSGYPLLLSPPRSDPGP